MTMVGVIGGMGPAATIDFMARVLALTPATRDQEHIHMLVDSDPTIADRNAAIAGRGLSPGAQIAANARRLQDAGCALLAMPCNTAHAFADAVRDAIQVPLIDMIDETIMAALAITTDKPAIGLLAADGCLAANLYQQRLAMAGATPVTLDASWQDEFMRLLYAIKAGDVGDASRAGMAALAAVLVAAGAVCVIAACTEVPIVLRATDLTVPLIVSTDVLAAAIVRETRHTA